MPGGGHFGFAVSDAAPFEFDVMGGEVPCLNDAERERGQSGHGPWHCSKDAASGFFMRVRSDLNRALVWMHLCNSLCTGSIANARILSEAIMTSGRKAMLCILFSFVLAAASHGAPTAHKTIYDYSLVGLDGKETSLSTYKGKVVLIVNLASKSIYKNQLASLEELQKTYADKGLVVLGIPSGDFGAEELPDNPAIQHFYVDGEHVTFPVFSKASLRGKDVIPLVQLLTDPKDGAGGGDIHWNFTKFVVDRQGKPVLRFEVDSDPMDPEFRVKIEQVLDGSFKKKDAAPKESAPAAAGDDDDDGE
jgi:glutathione peroxidase